MESNDIDDFLNKNSEEPEFVPPVVEEKSTLKLLEERLPMFLIIVVAFILLSLRPLNQMISYNFK